MPGGYIIRRKKGTFITWLEKARLTPERYGCTGRASTVLARPPRALQKPSPSGENVGPNAPAGRTQQATRGCSRVFGSGNCESFDVDLDAGEAGDGDEVARPQKRPKAGLGSVGSPHPVNGSGSAKAPTAKEKAADKKKIRTLAAAAKKRAALAKKTAPAAKRQKKSAHASKETKSKTAPASEATKSTNPNYGFCDGSDSTPIRFQSDQF